MVHRCNNHCVQDGHRINDVFSPEHKRCTSGSQRKCGEPLLQLGCLQKESVGDNMAVFSAAVLIILFPFLFYIGNAYVQLFWQQLYYCVWDPKVELGVKR